MRQNFLLILLFSSCAAWGQSSENTVGKANLPQSALHSKPIATSSKAYASATFGNGVVYGRNITDGKSMEWRAFEVRFGKEIDVPAFIPEKFVLNKDEKYRVDFIHYNEGHPFNNHRDGFSTQLVYGKSLNRKLDFELGLGPYFSMNTTSVGAVEYDKKKFGTLLSIAALVDLGQFSPGLHMRFGLNQVMMPGAHSSVAGLVGVGKYFDSLPVRAHSASSGNPIWLGVAAGPSQTNHGDSGRTLGFSAEAKKYYAPHWAASISAQVEGNDDVRVHRNGVAIQGWFVQPLTENWAASVGIGPYAAVNNLEAGHLQLHGLITFQVERSVGRKWKGFVSFSRVAAFSDKNDRDLVRFGVMKQIGE